MKKQRTTNMGLVSGRLAFKRENSCGILENHQGHTGNHLP